MSRNIRRARIIILIGSVLLALGAALMLWDLSAADRAAEPVTITGETGPRVLRVPDDYATIQSAVDEARPGDMVLVGPGVYRESVIVETDQIVIRGLDRNEVVIDGEFDRENGIIVFSDGVAVENLTVRNNTENGLIFTGDYDHDLVLTGYRASYVTAHNNGSYGIYAFNATHGLIEHSYGSGHPESAFYIGQCSPCNALLIDSIGENNTFGYTGTNASTGLYIAANRFVDNRIGAAPHSGSHEELPPQRDSVLVGNYVASNNSPVNLLSDRTHDIDTFFHIGVGIWIRGGNDNLITRYLLVDNLNAAVLVEPNIDSEQWIPSGNRVLDNSMTGSNFDLVLIVSDDGEGPLGNCFEGNEAEVTLPADLEVRAACSAEPTQLNELVSTDGFHDIAEIETSYRDVAAPPPQPQMPDASTAPAMPASAIDRLDSFDPDDVELPLTG